MAYEVRSLRRYKARYNSDNTDNPMRFAVVRDGEPHAVVDGTNDTATITVYPPGSTTAIETATSMSITTGKSVISVSLDTSADVTNYTTRTGYRGDVTYTEDASGAVYTGHIIFDIAPYLLHIPVTFDQLQDMDARLRGMDWAGDDDFSGVIEACRDEFQLRLEAIADEYGLLLETMAIDANKLAVPFRRYVLIEILAAKNEDERLNDAIAHHQSRFDDAWGLWQRQFKPDKSHSGSEDSRELNRIYSRLYT